jgi:serine/threonine protein kinase
MGSSRTNEFATSNASDLTQYSFGREIGHGAYAVVKEAIHKPTGERVAIKMYDRFKLVDIQRKKQAIREIRIQSRLNHKNICKLYEAIDTPKYVYLVMEYVQGESLHAHLKASPNRRFSEEKAKRIIH